MMKYGATTLLYTFLLLSILICGSYGIVVLLCPALFYPVPLIVLMFIPSILIAKHLGGKYETSGTALSRDAERTAQSVMWAGVVGVIKTLLSWLLAFGSNNLSTPY
jgi:hypothetical protein